MEGLDLRKKGKKKSVSSGSVKKQVTICYDDSFALELMHDLVQERGDSDFSLAYPHWFGFSGPVTSGEFYAQAMKYGRKLCQANDIFAVAYHKEKIGHSLFYLGMRGLRCSDGEYRIFTFYLSKTDVLHIGTALGRHLNPNVLCLFRK
jgi:hypothetical protein